MPTLTLHRMLINIRNDLGYKKEERGVCVIYAEKGIDAFLVGDYATEFKSRNAYISKYYAEWPGMFRRAKEEVKSRAALPINTNEKNSKTTSTFEAKRKKTSNDQVKPSKQQITLDAGLQMALSVAALIDQGELYFSPLDYTDVFDRMLTNNNIQDISVYAQSSALEAMGGRALLASFFGIYSREELNQYGILLNKLAISARHDFALSLSSTNHRIGLCYSHTSKTWLLIDANQPSAPYIAASIVSTSLFIRLILQSFSTKIAQFTDLKTQIFTTGAHHQQLKVLVDKLITDDAFIAIHAITRERATRVTPQKMTLSLLATLAESASTLQQLSQLSPAIPMNEINDLGFSAIFVAAAYGDVESLKILIPTATDLNQSDTDGRNPLFITARYGHVEAFQILFEAHTHNDNLTSVDLNQADHSGMTPVLIAAKYGHAQILHFLANARAPSDNKPLVDLNQTDLTGATPALITASFGHTKAFRVLTEAKIDGNAAVNLDKQRPGGMAPIHGAAYYGHIEIVQILIDSGVNMTCLYKGRSALQLAFQQGHTDIVNLLSKTLELSDQTNRLTAS